MIRRSDFLLGVGVGRGEVVGVWFFVGGVVGVVPLTGN